MDEKFRKQMEENGADVETTLKRFLGKEELYLKFIKKFQDDKSLEGLQERYDNVDYEGVFEKVHSLKGVAGNLGLNPIYEISAQICDLLRGKQPAEVDVEKLKELKNQLEEAYQRFLVIIQESDI